MIDTSKQKWDFSKEEKYAVEYLNEHGFSGELEKQCISKTVFSICKDGVQDCFELPQGLKKMDVKKYMEQFSKNWEMLVELVKLREAVK